MDILHWKDGLSVSFELELFHHTFGIDSQGIRSKQDDLSATRDAFTLPQATGVCQSPVLPGPQMKESTWNRVRFG